MVIEELSGCVTKECEDVEVVCSSSDVERISEVKKGIETCMFCIPRVCHWWQKEYGTN